eukprot:TRINITY_DN1178_c0_g1_i1.p1 TRINITY_DN1178_c0_g1~~TRINITY_DN1178_c0_g1_i1.p1  ORF type:complete len:420 (+),score=138.75 TRINITY_DN1178_c0_g1_i1:81-1262(+)
MNLLWISVVFCLIATGACQSSSLLLSTVDANWNFTIAVNSSGSVSFTRNSSPYAVLQNLPCSIGQYPQYDGSAWTCGTNLSLTSDPLGALASSCNNTVGGKLYNVPAYNGSTTSFSSCAADSDVLSSLSSCTSGQLAAYGAAGAAACATDSDIAASAATSCSTGGTPRFASNTSFACGLNLTDNDTAKSLLSSCLDGQLARWNGTAWMCDYDYNLLSPGVCTDGQTIVATNTSWACASDSDALAQLIPSCTGSKDTPQYTTSGGWICVASPVISLSAPVAQTMVTGTYLMPAGVWVPSSSSFTGVGGVPFYFTNNTVVKSWTVRNLGSSANITAALWAGSAAVSTQQLNNFSYFYEAVVASAVTPGLVGVQLYNKGSTAISVTIDILVELSLA